jgi:O-antigen/teichoic acid export membrane protein
VSSLGYATARNVDYAIVAGALGAAQTGLYWRAYQLAFEYQGKLTLVMQTVAFPVFARTRDLDHMRRVRYRIVRAHAVVIFPLLAAFVVVAPVLVPWLYGEQWEAAVVPSQILAVAGFASPVLAGVGPFVLALGRPRRLMVVNWLSALGYAAVLLLTASRGLTAVCLGVLGFSIVNLMTSHHFLLAVPAGISGWSVWHEVRPAAVAAAVTLGIGWLAREGATVLDLPSVLVIAASLAAAGGTYVAVIARLSSEAFADLKLIVERVARRRRAPVPETASPAEQTVRP